MQTKEQLAILDMGGQYTKVIDRRIRELGVKSDIFKGNTSAKELEGYQAIILSGGPQSVCEDGAIACDPAILDLGVPILGICYGLHWLNQTLGGAVSSVGKKEYGATEIRVEPSNPLYDGLAPTQMVLMNHGDSIAALAPGLVANAWSEDLIVGFSDESKGIYGIQFHPEVDLTEHGQDMLRNFLRNIAKYQDTYSLEDRIETSIRDIREKVGDNDVLVLVSGGVDSAVTAALLLKALDPNKVYAIHIDSGLMRKNESDEICRRLGDMGLVHLVRENAQDLFFHSTVGENGKTIGPLTSLIDPEEKRNLVGTMFLLAMKRAAAKLNIDSDTAFWAQGTLRPDLIESGNPDISANASRIKTHHNDVDMVRKARDAGRVVETNKDWHKDEVRNVARMLGLGEDIASRQPFPGPGLSVRVLCQTEYPAIDPADTDALAKLLEGSGYQGQILPLKSVGVQGDARSYRNLVLLWGKGLDGDGRTLSQLARRIPNAIPTVNRVAYLLNKEQPGGAIQCHPMHIGEENVDILREVDALVTAALTMKPVSQSFAVLLPIGVEKQHSVALRAFVTNDFMTGRAALLGSELPKEAMAQLVERIQAENPRIDLILYDITDKPPATCEWQ